MQQVNIYDASWAYVGCYWTSAGKYANGYIFIAPIAASLGIKAPAGNYYHKAL